MCAYFFDTRAKMEYFNRHIFEQDIVSLILTKKPYRLPSNYINYVDVVRQISAIITKEDIEKEDDVLFFFFLYLNKWINDHSPIYCIKPEQLESFIESRQDYTSYQLTIPLTNFIFVPPKGHLKSPTGDITWMVIHHTHSKEEHIFWRVNLDENKQEQVTFVVEGETPRLIVCFIDSNGYIYHEIIPLVDGIIQPLHIEGVEEEHRDFAISIRNIAILSQIAISLEHRDANQVGNNNQILQLGFGKGGKKPRIWYPRFIPELKLNRERNNYPVKISRTSSPKRTHVRKAHTKTVRCGKGRKDKRIVYIPETIVKP